MQKVLIAESIIRSVMRRGTATRQELLEDIPIRPATLFAIIRELSAAGLLSEPERKGPKTGRKASPIQLAPDMGFFIGIDMDMGQIRGVCIDGVGHQVATCQASSPCTVGEAQKEILGIISILRKAMGKDWKRVKGIGFADPGLVDPNKGYSLKAVNVEGWENLATGQWLRNQTKLDSVVHSGANARAYAEFMACSQPTSLLNVHLDIGIGGGFVKDEQLFVGDSFCAMELGHIIIQQDGPICQCGNQGCLEALAGFKAIQRQVQELNQSGVHTSLTADTFSFEQLCDCVEQQDKVACSLVQTLGEHIGAGLAAAITILNPASIVLSGGLAVLGEQLVQSVRRCLDRLCFREMMADLDLRTSGLPCEATAQGAALLMRREYLLQSARGTAERTSQETP